LKVALNTINLNQTVLTPIYALITWCLLGLAGRLKLVTFVHLIRKYIILTCISFYIYFTQLNPHVIDIWLDLKLGHCLHDLSQTRDNISIIWSRLSTSITCNKSCLGCMFLTKVGVFKLIPTCTRYSWLVELIQTWTICISLDQDLSICGWPCWITSLWCHRWPTLLDYESLMLQLIDFVGLWVFDTTISNISLYLDGRFYW